MITQGPFDLTIGDVLPLSDPGASSNNPAVSVQIQNASPFIVEVNSGGTVLTIQSFTAQTVATSGGGQQMSVAPMASGGSAQTLALLSLTVVWLLAGEQSPMADGALTAAAIATSIGEAGLAGASVTGYQHTLAAGGTINPVLGAGNFRLWNWGFTPFGGSPPTTGMAFISFGPIGSLVSDTVSVANPASNNLAGVLFSATNLAITNDTDAEVDVFIDYSPA
jgi:hypothetical protein